MVPPAKKTTPNKRLPYLGSDVQNRSSFRKIIETLVGTICASVREGKSVTASNKDLIYDSAIEIEKACDKYFELVAEEEERYDPTFNSPQCYKNVVTDLTKIIKEEVSSIREEIKVSNEATTNKLTSTYASIAGRQTQARDTPGPAPKTTPAAKKPAAATPPTTKPAIVVVSKTPGASREETLKNCKATISFKDTNYAPARVVPVSNNKLRFEFDSERDRDDALQRIRNAKEPKVSAEVANRLKPMAILKGISSDVAVEELTDVILTQNPELSDFDSTQLKFKFKRDNRNPSLYNAVFVTHPSAFRVLLSLERVRVDYQRVHVEEFSPFLQCHACLQFGHTSTHCKAACKRCAHCAEPGHSHKECTITESFKCFNCIAHNIKFSAKSPDQWSVNHKATSDSCFIVRSMRNKTRSNIDYGSAPLPSLNSAVRTAP